MKNKILNIVESSDISIKSQTDLLNYINFCLNNCQGKKIPGLTEHHHILPKSKGLFSEYSNLKENSWNGVHLSFENHYIAHSMLVDALKHEKIIYAWNRMNVKIPISEQSKIIGSKKYKELRELHRNAVIQYNKNRIVSDKTRKKMGKNNKGFVTAINKITGETFRTTKEKYDLDDNLIGGTPGKVTVIDIRDNTTKQVTVYEFNNNDFYHHCTKGMVVVKDIRDGSIKQVTKDEYKKSEFLVGSTAKKIIIFNEKDEVVYSMPRSEFKKLAIKNKYPWGAFESSEKTGEKIYQSFSRKENETRVNNNGNIRFKGWYVKSEFY